jgi:integrase
MGRGLYKLNARGVATTDLRGRYADGGGLYLQVDGRGTRQWTFRFQIDGRRSEMSLGSLSAVPLAKARELAAGCRAELAAGRNPLIARRDAEAAQKALRSKAQETEHKTFSAVAEELLASKETGWRNAKHRAQWRMTLKQYAASLWAMPVDEIVTEHVLACLNPIWTEKPETASRTRGRIEAVLNAARARGFTSADKANPARWRGHLDHLLPKPKKLLRGHHAALPWKELPAFVSQLRNRDGVAALALEFIILTAARSGEARGARWEEIDLASKVWTVPATRMKALKEHRVPLTARAIEILRRVGEPVVGDLVFQGGKPGRPLSDMAFVALFNRMGVNAITTHGFRSTIRDWAGEATNFPRELAEAALAHTVGDKVERAYRRGDALERRRLLMEAWAVYCSSPGGSVVAMVRPAV